MHAGRVYTQPALLEIRIFHHIQADGSSFVADISNPTAPKLLGELEVSGFSEYLHMWDDTHVLGIGYGDSQQSKIKLTMFDVSDPTKPVEVNQKLIDSSESWSNEFVYNYKAILADPEKI